MTRVLSRRRVLGEVSAAACLGWAGAGSARAAGPIPIKIAQATGTLNLTMDSLMRQQGFFESFGLAPEILGVADGSKILSAIVSGSVDASARSGFGQVFPAVEQGAGLKLIAAGALAPILSMFTAKPNVNSLKDLEGKTIGSGSVGALVYQLTVTLLKKYKVDTSKIRFVNIGSSANIFRAVSAGTVDAGLAETSMIGLAGAYHVRPVPHGIMALELPLFTYNGSWTSDQKIATDRDALVRMLAACAKLYRFIQSPAAKEPFLRCSRQEFPNSPEAEHLANWNFIQTYRPFAENLILAPERLQYVQALNVEFGIQKTILPYEKVADMSLAREALKLLG